MQTFTKSDFVFNPDEYQRSTGCTDAASCQEEEIVELEINSVSVSKDGLVTIKFKQEISFLIERLDQLLLQLFGTGSRVL